MDKVLLSALCFLLSVSFVLAQSVAWKINEGRGPFIPDPAAGAPTVPIILGMLHGGEGGFEYANIPGIFAPGWRNIALDETGNLNFNRPSAISGFMTQLDFTYFQAIVEINDPSKSFILRYNSIDDGVIAYVFNSEYPEGIADPNGGIRLYRAPAETDLSPLLVEGSNIIVLVQFDDSWTENRLNVSVIREDEVSEECPTYTIAQQGTSASCFAATDATFFVQGNCEACNSEDFLYSINGGESFQSESFFTDLSSGDYNVVIRNTAYLDCDQTFDIFLGFDADTEVPNIISCPEDIIVALGTNGEGRIIPDILIEEVIAQDNCSELLTITLSDTIVTPLTETVSVTVTDEAGNSSECIVNVIISVPCNLFITGIDASLGDCPTVSNMLTISTNEPGTELEYSIDGINYQSSNVFTNVEPGFYSLAAREVDNIGCFTTAVITIQEGEDTIEPELFCPTDTDTLLFSLEEGVFLPTVENLGIFATDNCSEVSYIFEPAELTNVGLSSILLTAMDDAGNTAQCSIIVELTGGTQTCEVEVGTIIVSSDNCPSELGEAQILASGAELLEYSLTGGEDYSSSNQFSGLEAGTYTVFVRDADNVACIASQEFTLEEGEDLIAPNLFCPTDTLLFPLEEGVFLPTVENLGIFATDNCSEVSYIFEPAELTNVGLSSILLTAMDDVGNTAQCSIIVELTGGMQACEVEVGTIIVSSDNCPGELGEAQIFASGAELLEYSLTGSDDYSSSNQFSGLEAGTYTVFVRDADNIACIASRAFTLEEGIDVDAPRIMLFVLDGGPSTLTADTTFLLACDEDIDGFVGWNAVDNCIGEFVPETVTMSETSPTGVKTVTYEITARDSSANVNVKSITLVITDIESPIIDCPTDTVFVNLDGNGVYTPTVESLGVSATDNCDINYTFFPSELTEIGLQEITVEAADRNGNTAECTMFVNVVGPGFGGDITTTNATFSMTLYPNPVQDQASLQLDLEEMSDVEITVFNTSGDVLQFIQYDAVSTGKNSFNLDFSTMLKGVYFVSVKTADSYETTKIVLAQ